MRSRSHRGARVHGTGADADPAPGSEGVAPGRPRTAARCGAGTKPLISTEIIRDWTGMPMTTTFEPPACTGSPTAPSVTRRHPAIELVWRRAASGSARPGRRRLRRGRSSPSGWVGGRRPGCSPPRPASSCATRSRRTSDRLGGWCWQHPRDARWCPAVDGALGRTVWVTRDRPARRVTTRRGAPPCPTPSTPTPTCSASPATAHRPEGARTGRPRWPLWGVLAGVTGLISPFFVLSSGVTEEQSLQGVDVVDSLERGSATASTIVVAVDTPAKRLEARAKCRATRPRRGVRPCPEAPGSRRRRVSV